METLENLSKRDRFEFFGAALARGRVGCAQKVAEVEARRATVGERIITFIAGEGIETVSRRACNGDWVVRSCSRETGYEEQLVDPETFETRYIPAGARSDDDGFSRFNARWCPVRFCVVGKEEGDFAMLAPWGEMQRFGPGDAVVQLLRSPSDIYRVHRLAFAQSYRILASPIMGQ